MKNISGNTKALAFALTAVFALAACDVDQTEEGALPEVDVEAQGGQMPAYDVETADVEVGTRPAEVQVPEVDVTMPDEQHDAEAEELDPADEH